NTVMPWLFDSIEPLADGLVAHFETLIQAQIDVFSGKVSPSGLLPITLPASEEVIAVDEDGECISRNDVPGYDKDLYLPEGMTYAYKDEFGNEYKLGFGLTY
ncbi:MAG: glycoside hydrolase family 3 protein, partial [Clostridiaceae bacterium]|nr:glycoside hydrolase family 3 protein [Clostridiaceae bacterium]